MWRRKTDPVTLGPRVIQLNNSPANAANRWVDNHVSTAKYNVATFLPKFLYEQFLQVRQPFFLVHSHPTANPKCVTYESVHNDCAPYHCAHGLGRQGAGRRLQKEEL